MPRVRWQGDGGEERDEQPDLGSFVELTAAREVRRDLSLCKGAQEGRRVGVVPHENRKFPKAALTAEGLARDDLRDCVGLFGPRDLLDVIDLSLV